MSKDLKKLSWLKIEDPFLIPRRLIDQIKGAPFTTEDFYKNWEFYGGPLTILFAILDREDLNDPCKGAFCLSADPMAKSLRIAFLTLNKEYQFAGFMKEMAIPKIKEILKALNFKSAYWATTRPKAFERLGYKRSAVTIMEGYIDE